jgi:hypothetical protein
VALPLPQVLEYSELKRRKRHELALDGKFPRLLVKVGFGLEAELASDERGQPSTDAGPKSRTTVAYDWPSMTTTPSLSGRKPSFSTMGQ